MEAVTFDGAVVVGGGNVDGGVGGDGVTLVVEVLADTTARSELARLTRIGRESLSTSSFSMFNGGIVSACSTGLSWIGFENVAMAQHMAHMIRIRHCLTPSLRRP